ncbi:MAG: MFS transporter [Proteobacteria bacterium]|nr:MFS transporter [Pseudomonadota bacterium]
MNSERKILKIVAIASIGGGLEMYDFVIYAFFAPVIGALFFPSKNHFAELLSAFAVFAIGYITRPIGAIVFGHFGDTIGRKKTLQITILLMALATVCIGLLPTYAQIGISASILLVIFRLLQGFAVGGDFPGAITFVSEHVANARRGLHCSWIYTGINLGLTLATIASSLITWQLSSDQIQKFGWRIGFLIGVILAGVGYFLRKLLEETPYFKVLLKENFVRRFPIKVVFKNHFSLFLKALGIVCLGAVVVGHMLFMPSYLHFAAKLSLQKALLFNTGGSLVWSLFILATGYLSDKWGRRKIIWASAASLMLFSYPLFSLIATAKVGYILIGLLGFAICMSGIIGVIASTLSELFPTHIRNSGIGAAYNIGFALFCSVSPLVMTELAHRFSLEAPSYWIIGAAIITFISSFTFQETANLPLPNHPS